MGMYDEINGEQVKCFPWVSFYKDEINYHGGELKYYATGSAVPYKKPHYNYGKNFIILDLNMYRGEPFGEAYNYILHIIVDGKVKNTLTDECANIDWSINNVVVGYRGELINVKNEAEFLQYIKAQREYWAKHDQINERHSQLFKESMEYFHGIGTLDKDSEEFKVRQAKLDEYLQLMQVEKAKVQPELDALYKEHRKWFVDTSAIDDLISLGDFISAMQTNRSHEENEKCRDCILSALKHDTTLYDRYVEWQGSDEYIKEFKEMWY